MKIEEVLAAQLPNYTEKKILAKEKQERQDEKHKLLHEYADFLKKPLREDQVCFWVDPNKPGAQYLEELFCSLHEKKEDAFSYVWIGKKPQQIPNYLKKELRFAKKDTRESWKALAVSKYIFCNTELPGTYVWREDQIYYEGNAFEAWFQSLSSDLKKKETDVLQQTSVKPQKSSRTLLLCNWNAKREQVYLLDQIVRRLIEQGKDILVVTPHIAKTQCQKSWQNWNDKAWNGHVEKRELRGYMVTKKDEYWFYEVVKSEPQLLMQNELVQKKMEPIIRRESYRIFQNETFMELIVVGSVTNLFYQLAFFSSCPKKFLYDMNSFSKLQKEKPQALESMVQVFDTIYVPHQKLKQNEYGPENQGKLQPWQLYHEKKQPEYVTLQNKQYLVAECLEKEWDHLQTYLVEMPKEGAILVYAVEQPNQACLEAWEKQGEYLYLYGPYAKEWLRQYKGKGEVCDSYIETILPLLPSAGTFLQQFSKIYGDMEHPDELLLWSEAVNQSVLPFECVDERTKMGGK